MRGSWIIGVLAAALPLAAAGPPGDGEVIPFVDKKVQERQPKPEDRKFDEIGWVKDIREALRLGKERQRPVFLFTHDGRINIGRC